MTSLSPVEKLLHPERNAILKRGEEIGRYLAGKTGFDFAIGGSALILSGRCALLAVDEPDVDMRIWIRNPGEYATAVSLLQMEFPIEEEKDQSEKDDVRPSGLPACLLKWHENVNGCRVRFEAQVRAEPVGGYHGMARRRLETLTNEQLAVYLNLKSVLKEKMADQYDQFKETEKNFWKLYDDSRVELRGRFLMIHQKALKPKKRMSGKSQSDHMESVASKTIALGGDWVDWAVAYLHDVIEEASDEPTVRDTIRSELHGLIEPERIEEIIKRIEILTEDEPDDPDARSTDIRDFLNGLATQTGESMSEQERDFQIHYVKTYRKFLAKLVREKQRIRIVELADRWDGLADLGYLGSRPRFSAATSLLRVGAILANLEAPPLLIREFEAAWAKWVSREVKMDWRIFESEAR